MEGLRKDGYMNEMEKAGRMYGWKGDGGVKKRGKSEKKED